MPTLKRRSDGCYYVVHWHNGFSTWQIDAGGVQFLAERDVTDGGHFSVDEFFDLFRRQLIYTEHCNKPVRRTPASIPDEIRAVKWATDPNALALAVLKYLIQQTGQGAIDPDEKYTVETHEGTQSFSFSEIYSMVARAKEWPEEVCDPEVILSRMAASHHVALRRILSLPSQGTEKEQEDP